MNSPPPPTLLSTLQQVKVQDLPVHDVHPFSTAAESSCATLEKLIATTEQLGSSLHAYRNSTWTNPKLVSLLKQHTAVSHNLKSTHRNTAQTLQGLRDRAGLVNYGEDVPMDPRMIPGWFTERLESWARLAGMETYKEDHRDVILLAGAVLVMEVEFAVDRADPLAPVLNLASIKTSYASSDTLNATGSASLDAFMVEIVQRLLDELKKADDVRQPRSVANLGRGILEQLQYLVMLDNLAKRQQDGGVRWFVDMDSLYPMLEGFAKNEASSVSLSLGANAAPLDIYLARCHGLPLPYLTSPSITFLIYVSPQTYLRLKNEAATHDTKENLPQLDIPITQLRACLANPQKDMRFTSATLKLTALADAKLPNFMALPALVSRPSFPLAAPGAELEHLFPQIGGGEMELQKQEHIWVLDFSQGGAARGVVMSQSRLREIELILNPMSGMDPSAEDILSFGIGSGSWVALLLNPTNPVSSERYTAVYRSPTSKHPPLQLRLTLPEEPGFFLNKVQVHSMKEVWGVLEIVREQCWLNETLLGCHWTTEGIRDAEDVPMDDGEATAEDLHAVLTGSIVPRKIPVNLSLPPRPVYDPSLDSLMEVLDRRTRILMVSPERPPMSGVVETTVAYDETRPRAVSVELSGAMGCDIKPDALEEIARRGGALSLPGRVWACSRGMS